MGGSVHAFRRAATTAIAASGSLGIAVRQRVTATAGAQASRKGNNRFLNAPRRTGARARRGSRPRRQGQQQGKSASFPRYAHSPCASRRDAIRKTHCLTILIRNLATLATRPTLRLTIAGTSFRLNGTICDRPSTIMVSDFSYLSPTSGAISERP